MDTRTQVGWRWLIVVTVIACGPESSTPVSPDARTTSDASATVTSMAGGFVVVSPVTPNGWVFAQETATGSGGFVSGPATAPAGLGSAVITVDGTGGYVLSAALHQGTRFADITALTYSTWQSTGNPNPILAIALQFGVDYDLTDTDASFQGRLVFEPYYTYGTPSLGTWQSWDALAGKWWATRAPFNASCSQASPCTWTQVLTNWPAAGVDAMSGGVFLKAGGGWSGGFTGNLDKLTIGVSGVGTTYDFEPALGHCSVSADVATQTLTLLADCTTDHTLLVPDGWTLDGNGFSITGVDPVGGHFLGAVVRNGGGVAHVTDLAVTVSGLADACDAGDDRLRGILFEGAAGSITNNVVTGINQGASGCQEGNAIEVRNAPFDDTGSDLTVTITDNTVSDYQKTGIVVNGSVAATITGNTAVGVGPVNYIAQNGIQIGFGATAVVRGNAMSGNDYTPKSYVSCGLLFYRADGVRASNNAFSMNERDQCNFGRGGGTFNPAP